MDKYSDEVRISPQTPEDARLRGSHGIMLRPATTRIPSRTRTRSHLHLLRLPLARRTSVFRFCRASRTLLAYLLGWT